MIFRISCPRHDQRVGADLFETFGLPADRLRPNCSGRLLPCAVGATTEVNATKINATEVNALPHALVPITIASSTIVLTTVAPITLRSKPEAVELVGTIGHPRRLRR